MVSRVYKFQSSSLWDKTSLEYIKINPLLFVNQIHFYHSRVTTTVTVTDESKMQRIIIL